MKISRTQDLYLISFGILLLSRYTAAHIGYFWHVTDFHFDNNYTVYGDPSQMCRLTTESNNSTENVANIGNYECDAPMALVTSAISAMKEIFPNPDFILWTGDDTPHVNDSFFSIKKVVDIIDDLTVALTTAFPDTLVIPALGNHDFFPQNQAPIGSNHLQTQVANLWKNWLEPFNAYDDFRNDGRYVADIPNSKVSFIALNTLLWYEMNAITAEDPMATDPAAQFAWIDTVIRKLASENRKAYLMGHIPPGLFERYFDKREGFHWYQERYNKLYMQMINKHFRSIPAQFYGHNHVDSFRVFLDENDRATSYLLIAPAVSPMKSTLSEETGSNNPGIRLISYYKNTGEVKEVSQYYLDLEKAINEGVEQWKLEYNLTDLLNLTEITAKSLNNATLKMKEDRMYFDEFYPINTVQWQNSTFCSEQCHQTIVCALRNIDYTKFYECNSSGTASFVVALGATLIVVVLLNFTYRLTV